MNKSIEILGVVRQNSTKNASLYIDATEGRVYLGKTSGFVKGQEIMGTAICTEQQTTYQAQPAILDGPYKRDALPAVTRTTYQLQNFISEEMQTKQLEAKARKAQANLNIAVISKKTAAVGTVEDIFALAV
jgi:hypothetical protein